MTERFFVKYVTDTSLFQTKTSSCLGVAPVGPRVKPEEFYESAGKRMKNERFIHQNSQKLRGKETDRKAEEILTP
ncbi:unnamed protein product [Acanthoscelides obtectus]|uniref:Uncharacterized protein n=1 Tax=Acanthoscelides obtectus TaxID=200917 RepID=A0A9P0K888_ACAOB|nr:unnamed protein product [Acanthoscelides obtectus]CAK1648303.1 hypothetical protein AOBTE_LOCUS15665 [Acanthoscelides obtectus]